jgi:uncharacterized membrane protein
MAGVDNFFTVRCRLDAFQGAITGATGQNEAISLPESIQQRFAVR